MGIGIAYRSHPQARQSGGFLQTLAHVFHRTADLGGMGMSMGNHQVVLGRQDQAGLDGKPRCSQCEGIELRRTGRFGFLQQVVAPWFGLFPWECGLCRKIYMLKQREEGGFRQKSAPGLLALPAGRPAARKTAALMRHPSLHALPQKNEAR